MRVSMRWRAIGALAVLLGCAGTALALTRSPREDVGVFILDVTTGARERITPADGDAAWSRDGRIYVTAGRSFEVFDVHGHRVLHRDVNAPTLSTGGVAVSPDGRRIAYLEAPRDENDVNTGDLVVGPMNGGPAVVRLTRARGTPA